MNYIGSKLSLLEFLDKGIHKIAGRKNQVFCDLFSGTGVVGAYFKKQGYKIIANDIQYYSYVLTRHYVGNSEDLKFLNLTDKALDIKRVNLADRAKVVICYLDNLEGVEGFIYKNYCPAGTNKKEFKRMYFTNDNGKKCDAIRIKIEEWKNKKYINEDEYFFLLASLLESIDKHANTASVYGAFLKSFKKSAMKEFILEPADLIKNGSGHKIYNQDINKLIREIKGDILYLDPPYNHRQYSANYHVLETIAKYDNPTLYGKTGLRECEAQKSFYCQKSKVLETFEDLIMNADMKYIFLSYNNEGLMSEKEVKNIMSKRGRYGLLKKKYRRFKADNGRDYKAQKTVEYLHYVICK